MIKVKSNISIITIINITNKAFNYKLPNYRTNDDINAEKLYNELLKVVGVVNVHDIHIWCVSIGRPCISLHIFSDSPQKSLEQATLLCKKYGIYHTTIQVEDNTQIKRISYIKCTHYDDNDIH